MTLQELFAALDLAVTDVTKKKTSFDTTESDANKKMVDAENAYRVVVERETARISEASLGLSQSVEKARDLQEQLQARTTSFLSETGGRRRG